MLNLCKYKNIIGEPNTGIHKYRFLNVSILDVLGTIIIAYGISWYFNYQFLPTLGILFLLGIFIHRVFCVRSTVDKILFPNIDE
jgi:hypothetical protein